MRSRKVQVVVDANVYGVLHQMSSVGLRGKSISEVAYKILDEWIWHNQEPLAGNGIVLVKARAKRKSK